VVAVDTTGTDPKRDHLQRIVTVNLGTGENTLIDVAHLDDAAGAEAVATAFEQLDEQLERSDAIAGNLVLRFTVPFLTAVARRAGFEWQTSLPGVDLHSLSLVVDPTLVGRGLTELADHFDVPLAGKGAAARAAATTELLRLMLDRYDPGDPTWALARACLARAEDPIARLLPAGGPIGDLADALRPMPDELATMGDGRRHAGTASAVAAAFATMRAHVPGYRDRPSQRAMADAIAAAMDGGDRLVVEAPTGTGKSLAYLVPAAGRAARPNS
jgi:ATP-dependent DNA helicase RecQ